MYRVIYKDPNGIKLSEQGFRTYKKAVEFIMHETRTKIVQLNPKGLEGLGYVVIPDGDEYVLRYE